MDSARRADEDLNERQDALELNFAGGGVMTIPRKLIPRLEDASASERRSADARS